MRLPFVRHSCASTEFYLYRLQKRQTFHSCVIVDRFVGNFVGSLNFNKKSPKGNCMYVVAPFSFLLDRNSNLVLKRMEGTWRLFVAFLIEDGIHKSLYFSAPAPRFRCNVEDAGAAPLSKATG